MNAGRIMRISGQFVAFVAIHLMVPFTWLQRPTHTGNVEIAGGLYKRKGPLKNVRDAENTVILKMSPAMILPVEGQETLIPGFDVTICSDSLSIS